MRWLASLSRLFRGRPSRPAPRPPQPSPRPVTRLAPLPPIAPVRRLSPAPIDPDAARVIAVFRNEYAQDDPTRTWAQFIAFLEHENARMRRTNVSLSAKLAELSKQRLEV